jgi:hypothetical protein
LPGPRNAARAPAPRGPLECRLAGNRDARRDSSAATRPSSARVGPNAIKKKGAGREDEKPRRYRAFGRCCSFFELSAPVYSSPARRIPISRASTVTFCRDFFSGLFFGTFCRDFSPVAQSIRSRRLLGRGKFERQWIFEDVVHTSFRYLIIQSADLATCSQCLPCPLKYAQLPTMFCRDLITTRWHIDFEDHCIPFIPFLWPTNYLGPSIYFVYYF